jgi:hypothetical protein
MSGVQSPLFIANPMPATTLPRALWIVLDKYQCLTSLMFGSPVLAKCYDCIMLLPVDTGEIPVRLLGIFKAFIFQFLPTGQAYHALFTTGCAFYK